MGNLDFSANPEQLQELVAYIASQINVPTIGIGGGDAPIGKIDFFDATTAPQDYLACDGTVYKIADYPQLADWYEAQHGSKNFYGGDGTTTFAVPDLRGEFLRGTGTNSHTNQGNGANVGVHQDGTIHNSVGANGSNAILVGDYKYPDPSSTKADWASNSGTIYYNTASKTPQNTSYGFTSRPTNTSFLICVKAVVAGDVYSTEERVGGTWIDGKKWYYKTVDCGALPNGTDKLINHGIDNIDFVFSVEGCIINPTTGIMCNIPHLDIYNLQNGLAIFVNKTQIQLSIRADMSSFTKSYVTLRYTKTTD